MTKLPSPDDGTNLLPVFIRCIDALGRQKTAHVTITMEGEIPGVKFDSDSADRYANVLARNMENGLKTRTSDIVAMARSLKLTDSSTGNLTKVKDSLKILTSAIAGQEITEVAET